MDKKMESHLKMGFSYTQAFVDIPPPTPDF